MESIHDASALANLRKRRRIEPHHLRRLANAFYKKQRSALEAVQEVPEDKRGAVAGDLSFHALALHSRHDSQIDGASKLIFRTEQGHLLESVILRIASGRTSLCLSSQVGCAARCSFCATGHMGIAVNLRCAEIVDQVIQANLLLRSEGRSIRNVVFMGMGEPLHNEAEVRQALDILLSPRCFHLAPGHIVLSTVGIPAGMVRCAQLYPRLGMALSLHSAIQEKRERLIPLAHRYPLEMLREALAEVTVLQHRHLMIEYLLLESINDSNQDMRALIEYLKPFSVHINLIPYNVIDEAPALRGTSAAKQRACADLLKEAGFPVTIRYSLGADIAAACGQLVRRENGSKPINAFG